MISHGEVIPIRSGHRKKEHRLIKILDMCQVLRMALGSATWYDRHELWGFDVEIFSNGKYKTENRAFTLISRHWLGEKNSKYIWFTVYCSSVLRWSLIQLSLAEKELINFSFIIIFLLFFFRLVVVATFFLPIYLVSVSSTSLQSSTIQQ